MSIDLTRTQQHGRPALPPAVRASVLPAAILLHSGAHALCYGTWSSAFVPLAALLMVVFLYLFIYLRGSRTPCCGSAHGAFVMPEGMSCRFEIA
jgi:hypothetical protein